MKDKPLYIVLVCFVVIFLVHLAGSKGWAQEFDPFVYDSDPNSYQSNVSVSQVITITFTSPMNPVTTADAFHFNMEGDDEDIIHPGEEGTLVIDGAILTFTPSSNLLPGTTYWVKIKSTATDLEGNFLDGGMNGVSGHTLGGMDGVGGEEDVDDWSMLFTTATTNPPPPTSTGGYWSQVYDQTNSGLKGKVSCLAVDSSNRLWVVTKEGSDIYRFDGHTWETKTPSINNFQISGFPCMTIDLQDRVWVGLDTYQMSDLNAPRLAKWENNEWQTISAKSLNFVQDEDIIKLAVDSLDNLWIVTSGGQVLAYSNGQVTPHPVSGLSAGDIYITSLTIDRQNNVWIGTAYLGVYELVGGEGTWQTYESVIPRSLGSVNYSIFDIDPDASGNIWVGTNDGLLKINPSGGQPGVWDHYILPTGSQSSPDYDKFVTALAVDPNTGLVWIGTKAGLKRFDGDDTWTNFAEENANELSNQSINALALNSRGEVWISTDNGLAMRDEVNPFVAWSFPGANDEVSTSVKVRISFSEPMKRTVTQNAFTLRDADQKTIQGALFWFDDSTLDFTPQQGALKANETYTVSVGTSATDFLGNPLAPIEYSVTFSTSGSGELAVRNRVDLAGSGCFIKSLASQSGSWLNRLLEFRF